jgi:cell division protein ZapA (FtsZ GTPase activity inhibitor)
VSSALTIAVGVVTALLFALCLATLAEYRALQTDDARERFARRHVRQAVLAGIVAIGVLLGSGLAALFRA